MCERKRCAWSPREGIYADYHDQEWGVPVYEDARLFEMLLLEGFQAGLSWLTILNKREYYRRAMSGFDARVIAAYGEEQVRALMADAGIVRCERKIRAAITNARVFLDIQKERGSFADYLWAFTDGKPQVNITDQFVTHGALADRVSADLKKRGMKYVGPVIIHSYLEAVGVINDHETGCFRYQETTLGNR